METLNAIISQKQASQDELLKLSGVTGVDVGYKYVNGKRTDQIAIRVMVSKKKANVAAKQQIPKEINGIPTDVIERVVVPFVASRSLETISLQADTNKYDPVKGGISIGPERSIDGYVFAGTLGCLVKDNATGEPRLLSNFHVMAVDNNWKAGDFMVQPSLVDNGVATTDRVGTLTKAILSDHVDGALSTLSGRSSDCSIVDIGDVKGTTDAALNTAVRKRGRTTLLTYGFVDAISGTVKIDYGDGIGVKTLNDQVGIRPDTTHNAKFSDHGDSGSVVVDENNNIIGLLFAGSEDGYTYINQITNVLSELNIQICIKTKAKEQKDNKEKEKEKEQKENKEKEKEKEKEQKEKEFKEKREWKEIFDKNYKQEFEHRKYFDNFPYPGMSGFPSAPLLYNIQQRLTRLEQVVSQLSAFIEKEQRPDLSRNVLRNEKDWEQMTEQLQKEAAEAMEAKIDFDNKATGF